MNYRLEHHWKSYSKEFPALELLIRALTSLIYKISNVLKEV